ncbi:MAG: hypothetical protein R8N23_07075 [Reichenbachiella sp.]|uniref:hypothetical protein n=1 Tax=Reichenbachiella sp. TaxID=2184521 RepID=UPI002966C5DE|nr:hypothetical protein [Reichenbachiella sp.]MDW3209609.1 hypothetical protein [Reichenbachiella sp.]
MNKLFAFLLVVCVSQSKAFAQDALYISTNKAKFVVGEQVMYKVTRFGEEHIEDEPNPVFTDLVAPNGQIIQTKSALDNPEAKHFFALPDSLKTGVYRMVSNSKGAAQAVKTIHVYALELEDPSPQKASTIQVKSRGGIFASGQSNKVVVRVLDGSGAGLQSKGTLVNSADSLVQYLDTDANGIVAFDLTPTDSLYKVRFGQEAIQLKPVKAALAVDFKKLNQSVLVKLKRESVGIEPVEILLNGESLVKSVFPEKADTLSIMIPSRKLTYGIHEIGVSYKASVDRKYTYFNQPDGESKLYLNTIVASNNEEVEYVIEDASGQIEYLDVSIIDKDYASVGNFYEEFYFDHAGLDLQLVENRDFEAYLIFFGDDVQKSENANRLSAEQYHGVLSYRENFPFDELSVLNLTTMKALDIRCESITGIHDFERVAGNNSQIFPFHFTTYLQPIEQAEFEETVKYRYPPLKSSIQLTDDDVAFVKEYNTQRNINLSFQNNKKVEASLPKADFTYNLEDYDVPNTMIDMINYVVKYVTVVKNKGGEPELSMYRYMSTYKYRGSPLIFLDDLPVYDKRTILNLNPKDISRVEVRNSYEANGHLGNFSLNGSVSFYLKDGVDNPLKEAYKDLPVLQRCQNLNKKNVESEFAPDFRHQLYWNAKLEKNKGSFWVDLKTSDLSTSYQVLVTAYMKDGTVMQDQSLLVVQ